MKNSSSLLAPDLIIIIIYHIYLSNFIVVFINSSNKQSHSISLFRVLYSSDTQSES